MTSHPAAAGELRIVSLIASATEIVAALGLEGQLVGRSHECDFPESVHKLPVCTAPQFDVTGSSLAIDERVKAVLQEGQAVYRVDAAKLRELAPTVIVTQAQCEVCAVSLRDVERALDAWPGEPPRVVTLNPNALADVWLDIQRVAEAAGVPERGRALNQRLQQRIQQIADQAQGLSPRPTVACLEWIDPLMAGGNWLPELVTLAGGVNCFGTPGKHSPWLTWEALAARDPDVVLVLPCGFSMERARADMPVLTRRPEWSGLRAVKGRRVYLADGNQYFNRPGPRLVESLEILAEILHPGAFHFGHEGSGWQSF